MTRPAGPFRSLPLALMVLALVYAQVGFLLQFELQRNELQRTMKQRIRQGIPKEDLTRFVMSQNEWQALQWVKPEREFRLPNGDMYDVVDIQVTAGVVDALCVHDKDETALFAGLDVFLSGQLDGPNACQGPRVLVVELINQLMPPGESSGVSRYVVASCVFPGEERGRTHPGHRTPEELPPKA